MYYYRKGKMKLQTSDVRRDMEDMRHDLEICGFPLLALNSVCLSPLVSYRRNLILHLLDTHLPWDLISPHNQLQQGQRGAQRVRTKPH